MRNEINQTGLAGHCFLQQQPIPENLQGAIMPWVERVQSVPEWCVSKSVDEALSLGLTEDEADFCKTHLLERQSRLGELMGNEPLIFGNSLHGEANGLLTSPGYAGGDVAE